LRERVRVGDALDVSSPRGSFIPKSRERPVVLVSAGIGATPVLAMLHALAADRSMRQVLWIHAARDGQHHPFAIEVRNLVLTLPYGRSYVCYSKPGLNERMGEDFGWSSVAIGLRQGRRTTRGGCLPVRAKSLHGGNDHDVHCHGRGTGADSRRDFQRKRIDDPWRRQRSDASSAFAQRRRRYRPAGIVRAQWHRRTLERVAVREHLGTGRGMRRPGRLVVPDWCWSQL